jgi:hypothetical protein
MNPFLLIGTGIAWIFVIYGFSIAYLDDNVGTKENALFLGIIALFVGSILLLACGLEWQSVYYPKIYGH